MKQLMDKNILVAISGGRSSAMMSYQIHTSEKYKDWNKVYCFANTGMERPETIAFLKNIEKHWGIEITKIEGIYSTEMGVGISYKIVDWEELDMNARPFEMAIAHKNKGSYDGLPNSAAPYCSSSMKTIPSQKFGNDIFGINNYKMAIGFRAEDMPKRISWAEIKVDSKRIFPLLTDFDKPISQKDLNFFFDKQPFKLEIHSKFGNCQLCWKKSEKNLIEIIKYGTTFIDWVNGMEVKYNNTMYRNKLSINDLVRMAKYPDTQEIKFDDFDDSCVCTFQ
jgi:hypothetical protein